MKLAFPAQKPISKNWLFYIEIIVAFLVITLVITVPYLNSQRAFLGGDINDGFYQFTLRIADEFRQSPWTAFQTVHQSFNLNYNKLFTLPLIPFVLIFGDSYLTYVVSLAIVYFLPFTLVMGALATQLIPVHPKAVFASTVLIAASLTPNWITILQGYPDISATLTVSMAMLVVLRSIGREFTWLLPWRWQVPMVGILFATTILLRRHFAYACIAIVGAMIIHTAIVFGLEFRKHPVSAWRNLWRFCLCLILIAATSLMILFVLAPEFIQRALFSDYVSLYGSWSRSVAETLHFYSNLYGWLVWLLVALGLMAGVLTRVLSIPIALFITAFGSLSLIVWLFKLRYTETYYAIHFVPFIILGIAALVWTVLLKTSRSKSTAFLLLISLFFAFNALAGLTRFGDFSNSWRSMFAASYPPYVRNNYDNIVQFVEFLRQIAPNQEPVFVAYSAHLPEYLVLGVERTLYGKDGSILKLLKAGTTDSDGFYPIQELLQAQYVVVTEPFSAWREAEQQAIKTVSTAFTQGWEITQDFQLLPQQFDLQNGVVAKIYRRIQPTPADRAVRTLHAMQMQVNKPLGEQLDWISLNQSPDSLVRRNRKHKQRLNISAVLPPKSPEEVASFLYLGTMPEPAKVEGRVVLSKSCQSVMLTVSPMNQQGQVAGTLQTLQLTQTSPLELQLDHTGAVYLLMQASPSLPTVKVSQPCLLKINQLVVSSQ